MNDQDADILAEMAGFVWLGLIGGVSATVVLGLAAWLFNWWLT